MAGRPVGLLAPPILLAQLLLTADAALPLPAYIKPCNASASREELRSCSTQHAQEAFPKFLRGDRRYHVPDLHPLQIDRLQVDDGHGPLGLNLVATQAQVFGFDRVRIDRVEFDMAKRHAWYDVFLPSMRINSKYNISGCILLLPITGYGDANLTLQDLYISYEYDFDLQKRADGETYFIPKPHSALRLNTSRLYIHLDNLFNGNKLLGDNTNRFINEHWDKMMTSARPIFSSSISKIVYTILTNIFQLVPFTDAFVDAEQFVNAEARPT